MKRKPCENDEPLIGFTKNVDSLFHPVDSFTYNEGNRQWMIDMSSPGYDILTLPKPYLVLHFSHKLGSATNSRIMNS